MNVRELARAVGLSHMTVSRALNGNPHVAPDTRERILRVAREHGYSIHAPARELATGTTRTIGILYPYRTLRHIESWYTSQLIHDVRVELEEGGFDSIVAGYDTVGRGHDDLARLCAQRKVDGVLVLGYEVERDALSLLARRGYHYLCVNPPDEPWMAEHPAVFVDQVLGGALAAQALLNHGCRRIATVCESAHQFGRRIAGLTERLGGAVPHVHLSDGIYETAYQLGRDGAEMFAEYDGLFVGSDVSAIGIINGLQDAGRRVPDDIAVVGFDDIEAARYSRPPLTTIRQPRRRVAAAVGEWLDGEFGAQPGTAPAGRGARRAGGGSIGAHRGGQPSGAIAVTESSADPDDDANPGWTHDRQRPLEPRLIVRGTTR